jgi:hypothetical protein
VLEELLKNSRSLRLLYLGMPSMSHVLDSLPSLIHLRYLFLFSCDEFQLQKVFKLYHLQVLQLEYLIGKKVNCTGIQNLYCLRCLHVPDNMSSSIHQIGRLTVLQELHGFEIVEKGRQRLTALGKLRSLSQLTLRNLQNVLNFKEAVDIRLKEKYYLKHLSLSWNKNLTDSVDQDGRIIDNLEPNKELQLMGGGPNVARYVWPAPYLGPAQNQGFSPVCVLFRTVLVLFMHCCIFMDTAESNFPFGLKIHHSSIWCLLRLSTA